MKRFILTTEGTSQRDTGIVFVLVAPLVAPLVGVALGFVFVVLFLCVCSFFPVDFFFCNMILVIKRTLQFALIRSP